MMDMDMLDMDMVDINIMSPMSTMYLYSTPNGLNSRTLGLVFLAVLIFGLH